MVEGLTLLQLRILMCFLNAGPEGCSNSSLNKTLGIEKYTLSRVCLEMERMGLIDRSNIRRPVLTEMGQREAEYYAERMDIAISHLRYEGVDVATAKQDAYYWALYNSEETMKVIRATEGMYRIKYEMRNKNTFSGAELCKLMRDGTYSFPFLIYREHVKDGDVLSMGNVGFESSCTMTVKNGEGTLQLRTVKASVVSPRDGIRMQGKVQKLKYMQYGDFNTAELVGDIISIPASALKFVNIGSGASQVLHGSVSIMVTVSVGAMNMPESVAVLTLLV